ncbi:DNA-binding protein [Tritonibacter scottomollicae]|uniref:helix-turn-helix domain-containing transcriptional regulator n=1 Tax=Tritonibacter scottomollicae TaxID=483013 RepID=UPI003BABA522
MSLQQSPLLEGDVDTGKIVLRDYINATVGFEGLAEDIGKPSKSLMRMLSDAGNPSATNLFAMISQLQKATGIHLHVRAGREATAYAVAFYDAYLCS